MIFSRLKSIRRNSGKKQAPMERMDSLASSGTPTESTRGGTARYLCVLLWRCSHMPATRSCDGGS